MVYKGRWHEEMINNRGNFAVADMEWSADGRKICIAYEDGAVICGAVGGNRLWGVDRMHKHISKIAWSPDGKLLLIGNTKGDIYVHSSSGDELTSIEVVVNSDLKTVPPLAALLWCDTRARHHTSRASSTDTHSRPYVDSCAVSLAISLCRHAAPPLLTSLEEAPSLAICYENGRLQLMRDIRDENPVLIDTGMRVVGAEWRSDGSVLAVAGAYDWMLHLFCCFSQLQRLTRARVARQHFAGMKTAGAQSLCAVQFYNPFGQNLCVLQVPGKILSGISWAGNGLKVALAVDSSIYFAAVRPDYMVCVFLCCLLCVVVCFFFFFFFLFCCCLFCLLLFVLFVVF